MGRIGDEPAWEGTAMALKIYGPKMSRVSRITWCANELGIPFEYIDVPWNQLKDSSFLALNPNGKSPAIEDGQLKLFESLAINLYLAKKYGTGELYPTAVEEEAKVLQWTLWAASEVEPLVLPSLLVKLGISKDTETAKVGAQKVQPAMQVLDAHLQDREWLVGKKFSIADLNVACVVAAAYYGDIDLSYVPNVKSWLERCIARPARNPAARD
jgi:glutathione S-transferase